MPVVIQSVEAIDHLQPRIAHVAVRFAQRPALPASSETTQLCQEGPAVSVMPREAGVTHLVQQHATLGPRTEPALNENVPPLWLEEPLAPVRAGQMMSAPHRARRDPAVKQLGVQLIEQQLNSGSSPVKRHLPGGNVATPRFEHAILHWPSAVRPSISSSAG